MKIIQIEVGYKSPEGGTQLWVGYGCAARSFDHHPIDHSHIVLIIDDLNGLGHLSEFADQIEPKTSLALAEIVNKCRCVGTRVWKKFLKSRFLINWHVNEYAVNIPSINLYLHYIIHDE